MAAYARRHYGIDSYTLRAPKVIVEHYTGSTTFAAAFATFARDVPDPELHELPGLCAHFIVDRDGTIYQLVSLRFMCRHTVGLNYTAIGIEHVGTSDREILDDRRQLDASLALTRWLRCRYRIRLGDVIGHSESLRSPYHRERVARLRRQTHADWSHADMRLYRRLLARRPCSAAAAAGASRGARPLSAGGSREADRAGQLAVIVDDRIGFGTVAVVVTHPRIADGRHRQLSRAQYVPQLLVSDMRRSVRRDAQRPQRREEQTAIRLSDSNLVGPGDRGRIEEAHDPKLLELRHEQSTRQEQRPVGHDPQTNATATHLRQRVDDALGGLIAR
jgi:beta-N-acetylhexosaminidase